jgi:hypothetical protein
MDHLMRDKLDQIPIGGQNDHAIKFTFAPDRGIKSMYGMTHNQPRAMPVCAVHIFDGRQKFYLDADARVAYGEIG